MKRVLTLALIAPGAALAHGGHAPVPEVVHSFSHTGPLLGLAAIVLAGGLAAYHRWMS